MNVRLPNNGGNNMNAMLKQAQKMQENMLKAQEEIAVMETTGPAGGGMVTVTVTGTSALKSIEIKPDVVDPDDIEMLQAAHVGAVMCNAFPGIQEYGDYVTEHDNNHNAIAEVIERFIL